MHDILETIVKHLVDNTDAVQITEKSNSEKEVTFEVAVSQEDMGKVIGRQGKIARSIRIIMKSVGGTEHKKVNVEFVD